MTHEIWHIICGGVGEKTGYTPAPVQWESFWRMTCGYKLSVEGDDREKLIEKAEKHIANMAEIAMETLTEFLGRVPPFESDVTFGGEYKGFGIGPRGPVVELHEFPVYTDFLITYSLSTFGLNHAQANALTTMLDIERYRCYVDIYKATGGEIHKLTDPYTIEVEQA